MNGAPELKGGDSFETRLLKALTEADARRPVAASPAARPRRRGRRRPGVLVVAVVAALVVAGGATAAASIVLRSDRPDKEMPLGTKITLRPGERTGIKGMGCQPGSVVTIRKEDSRCSSRKRGNRVGYLSDPSEVASRNAGNPTRHSKVVTRCDRPSNRSH